MDPKVSGEWTGRGIASHLRNDNLPQIRPAFISVPHITTTFLSYVPSSIDDTKTAPPLNQNPNIWSHQLHKVAQLWTSPSTKTLIS